MKTNYYFSRALLVLLLLVSFQDVFSQFKVVGYAASWSAVPSAIQYNKLTHINYSFIRPTGTGGLTAIDQPGKLQDIVSRAHASGAKVGIAIGGWSDFNNWDFQSMAGNASYRSAFVNNVINLLNQYNLDGVDIDWEFPKDGNDPQNFALLMSDLKNSLQPRGKFVSAAVQPEPYWGVGILNSVFASVDMLNLMIYDLGGANHSSWQATLDAISYWTGRGCPASKLTLGVPFYSRSAGTPYKDLLAQGASPNSDSFNGQTYNGIPTIKAKTNLAFDRGIGGMMIWEISQDATGANSLLSAMHDVKLLRDNNNPPPPQGPYLGTARNIPGTIEAEHFDVGGQGIAYNDVTGSNDGGALRTGEGVDIETCTDGGQNVGYIAAGEWLEYTVNVTGGTYNLEARVASTSAGKSFHVEIDGQNVSGTINVPNTTNWQTWQTVSVTTTNLAAGQKILRIVMDTDGFNLSYIKFSGANQSPNVNITSPTNGASFNQGSTITINANASDADGSVAKVEFFHGTTKIGEDASSPYSVNWTGAAIGTYSLTAKATDNLGATKTSAAVSVTVKAVIVQSPYGGSVRPIPGKVEAEHYDNGGEGVAYHDVTAGNSGSTFRTEDVDIEATNDGGPGQNVGWTAAGEWMEYMVNVTTAGAYNLEARVAATAAGKRFHVELDGQTIGTINVPNTGGWQTWQTVSVTTTSLTTGEKVLRIFMDTDGINLNSLNFTTSSPNNAPTVNITSPANNASFAEGVTVVINANAADSDGSVAKVEFYRGTTLIGTDNASPYTINWTGTTPGTYALTAKATDDKGAVTTSAVVSVTVTGTTNSAPTVSITSPANNSSATEGTTITINANAADADGNVTKVEFFRGSTKLGEDAIAPYSINWSGATAGTYSLTAIATDNKGATTTSATVAVTVIGNSDACSGIAQYQENNGYVAGSKVQAGGKLYECLPWPNSGWCNGASWAYGPGSGAYWSDAWKLLGNCSGARSAANSTETSAKAIEVYPNPTDHTSAVKLTIADATNAEVSVVNSMGVEIYKGTLSSSLEGTINLAGMESGIYMVKVIANGNVYVEKLLKR